jgi:hypothetical protein
MGLQMATLVHIRPVSSRKSAVFVAGAVLAGLLWAAQSRAEPALEPPQAAPAKSAPGPAKATRRSGFTASVNLGPSLGGLAGFQNDSRKIGRARYYTETVGAGGLGTGWIGAALSDWLNFGVGGAYGWTFAPGVHTEIGGILFRVEAFPLWSLGGAFRDVGMNLNGGVGLISATAADDIDKTLVNGGLASWIGVGAFYEGIRLWRLSMGPFAVYDYVWSSSVRLPVGTIGWRTTLYVGP